MKVIQLNKNIPPQPGTTDITEVQVLSSLRYVSENSETYEQLASKAAAIINQYDLVIGPVGSPAFWHILSRKINIPILYPFNVRSADGFTLKKFHRVYKGKVNDDNIH